MPTTVHVSPAPAGAGETPHPLRWAVRQLYGGPGWARSVNAVVDLIYGALTLVLLGALLVIAGVLSLLPPLRRFRPHLTGRALYAAGVGRRSQLSMLLGVELPPLGPAVRGGITGRPWRDGAGVTIIAATATLNGALVISAWALGALLVQLAVFAWLEPPQGNPITAGLWTPIIAYGGFAAVLVLAPLLALGGAQLNIRLARGLLSTTDEARLSARVDELTQSRAGVVEAVDAERRRIERDLHDGVQQRLVALGMLVGRARRSAQRDPASADALLGQAHDAAQQALVELRDVSWTIYPAILDDRGLDAALSSLASRTGAPVHVSYGLTRRLPPRLETVAYFVVCEAVTNAVKHAGADHIEVTVTSLVDTVLLVVRDDGSGGAAPTGSGLRGLAQRVAAVDGTFRMSSPHGGPTIITVELPCAP